MLDEQARRLGGAGGSIATFFIITTRLEERDGFKNAVLFLAKLSSTCIRPLYLTM